MPSFKRIKNVSSSPTVRQNRLDPNCESRDARVLDKPRFAREPETSLCSRGPSEPSRRDRVRPVPGAGRVRSGADSLRPRVAGVADGCRLAWPVRGGVGRGGRQRVARRVAGDRRLEEIDEAGPGESQAGALLAAIGGDHARDPSPHPADPDDFGLRRQFVHSDRRATEAQVAEWGNSSIRSTPAVDFPRRRGALGGLMGWQRRKGQMPEDRGVDGRSPSVLWHPEAGLLRRIVYERGLFGLGVRRSVP